MSASFKLGWFVYVCVALSSLAACTDGASSVPAREDDGTAERDDDDAPSDGRMDASTRRDGSSKPALDPSDDIPRADASAPDAGKAAPSAPDASAWDARVPDPKEPDAKAPDAKNYDWQPGDYPSDLHAQRYLELKDLPGQGGRTRGYKVHVPPGYSASKPAPVLYSFHGLQQNAVMFTVDGTSLVAESDAEGFVLVMPNGIQEDGIGGSWNAGVCCGAAASAKLDEVGFVRAIHAAISEHLNIDRTRVYATGLSNGAFMTHRLGCEAADLFAAIAPLAGSIGTSELGAIGTNRDPDLKSCNPSRPIPVLAMHGNGDGIVPYSGMKPSLDHWAKVAGCAASTSAATLPKSGGDTTCVSYRDCPAGIEITGCTVDGGGHCWFGNESCGTGYAGIGNLFVGNDSDFFDASKAVWEFVSRFHL